MIEELFADNGKIYIKCSPSSRITISTKGRRSESVSMKDTPLTEASFEIKEKDEYVRIDVIDEKGRRANTQAYFVNELK